MSVLGVTQCGSHGTSRLIEFLSVHCSFVFVFGSVFGSLFGSVFNSVFCLRFCLPSSVLSVHLCPKQVVVRARDFENLWNGPWVEKGDVGGGVLLAQRGGFVEQRLQQQFSF